MTRRTRAVHGPTPADRSTVPRPPVGRRAVLRRDGWAALLLGSVARCYLTFLAALTIIAAAPLALGWSGSVVQSGSMRPAIEPGDVVLATPLPADSPVPLGGVVQFRGESPDGSERLVVHRVVSAGDRTGEWVTAGDANTDVDSVPLTRDDITGQGRLLVRWVGLPSWWLRTGDVTAFGAWFLMTAGAAGLTLWARSDGAGPGADADDGADDAHLLAPAPGTAPAAAAPASRDRSPALVATALALAALIVAGVSVQRTAPAEAAFTARTSSAHNTFRVATWPTLALGRSASYAVIAATRVANVEVLGIGSSVTGSVAITPGTGYTGFWPWDITGSVDKNTAVAAIARADAAALSSAARARPTTTAAPASLTGRVTPGVLRRAGAVQVSGTLTLDAQGDPGATFVVEGTSLTFAPGARVELVNGAASDKVLFVSTGTTVVADNASVRGVLLGSGDVTLQRGTVLRGRAFSLDGAVTLARATVEQP